MVAMRVPCGKEKNRLGIERRADLVTGKIRVVVYRPWTPDEQEYLATNYGRTPMATMQRHLHRHPRAIEAQAERQDLRKLDADFGYTVVAVARIVGRDPATVTKWCEAKRLAATRRHTEHPRDPWAVTAKALRVFVLECPEEVNPGRAAAGGCWHLLVDIIANQGHGAGEFGVKERRETEEDGDDDEG